MNYARIHTEGQQIRWFKCSVLLMLVLSITVIAFVSFQMISMQSLHLIFCAALTK